MDRDKKEQNFIKSNSLRSRAWPGKPPPLMLHSILHSGQNGHFVARTLGYGVQVMTSREGSRPLSEMLGAKSVLDFRIFQILKYLHTSQDILGMAPKFKHKTHLFFIYTVCTKPQR